MLPFNSSWPLGTSVAMLILLSYLQSRFKFPIHPSMHKHSIWLLSKQISPFSFTFSLPTVTGFRHHQHPELFCLDGMSCISCAKNTSLCFYDYQFLFACSHIKLPISNTSLRAQMVFCYHLLMAQSIQNIEITNTGNYLARFDFIKLILNLCKDYKC